MPYVFIFYSPDDSPAVYRLVERLRRMYFEVRLDAGSTPDDTRLSDAVQDTIGDAQAVVLVLSPATCASSRLNEEVGSAKAQRKRIIPVQISLTTQQERNRLSIDPLTVIDFVPDEDAGFRALMDQDTLPPPLARDYRRLDAAFNQTHISYLRSLVARCNAANLTYLLDAAPADTVTVKDIYVALKIDVVLNIRPGSPVDDWWLTNAVSGSHSPEVVRARSLDGFSPQYQPLQALIEKIKAQRSLDSRSAGSYRDVLDAETAVALTPYLVITGDPGSGKSTLMKHLLLCMAGDMLPVGEVPQATLAHLPFWIAPAYTPIYIEMRELISVAFPQSSEEITLPKFLDYLQREQLAPYGISTYLPDLRDQMSDGDVMFFLDGLDEVPHAQEAVRRQQIKAFVHLLQAQFPRCRIVVTSRPYAYAGDWSLDGFGQVHLSILDPDHLQELAWRLFLVVLDRESAEKDAALFKQQIAKVPDSLRNSPLFFTLMAAIWLNNRAKPPDERLPVNKGAIYRECIEALIRRWTRHGPHQTLSPAEIIGLTDTQLRDILETLAYRVHHDWHQEDDAVFAGQHIFDIVRALDIRGVDEGALLDALSQRAGVIFEKAPDRFQFAHRSLQEYLAACYLSRPTTYPKVAVEMIRSAPQHWHNVVDLLPEEVQRRHGDLWALVRDLLSMDDTTLTTHHDEQGWAVYYAYQIMRDYLATEHEMQAVYRPALRLWIEKVLHWGVLPISARAELGNVLGTLGDTRCGVGLSDGIPDIKWCDIPAGPFVMGSDDQIKNPRREVHLSAFKICKFPITNMQYSAFLNAPDGYQDPKWWNGLHKDSQKQRANYPAREAVSAPNHPVIDVSWYDAMAFCTWLSDKLGAHVRLPSDEEWEKAARGTDERDYPWGDQFTAGFANVDARWGSAFSLKQTTTVGLYPQGVSPYGAHDMSGNVWEWTLTDFWRASHDNLMSDAPRSVRGGSWNSYESFARTIYRHTRPADFRGHDVGFRIVMVD